MYHKTSYHNLRVFGCAAFAHIEQDKLLPRAKKCIFLGYPDGVKGYKLWGIEKDSKKIIRDVTFNESEMPLVKGRVQKSVVEVQGAENKVDSGDNESMSQLEEQSFDEEIADTDQTTTKESNDYQLVQDRLPRVKKPTQKFEYAYIIAYALAITKELNELDLSSYKEAISRPDKKLRIQAMKNEMSSLLKNNTWDVVDRPLNQKLIGFKWIFKRKEEILSVKKSRYKARLVAKGFLQREGIYYNEIFSPVVTNLNQTCTINCC